MSADQPLTVLHVNTERTWRGGEQQTLYLLDGLAARGVKNILVAKLGGAMAERARAAGHEVVEMRMRGEADVSVPWRIRKLIREHGVQLLHAHTSHGHVYIQLAAVLCGRDRPQVIVHRRVDFSIFRRSFLGLNRFKYLHGVDRYVTVSRAIKRVLEDDGIPGERIRVVHSGIDMSRIEDAPDRKAELRAELAVPEGHALVVNVAHFADHKGQIYLVEAAPKIFESCPETVIAIVGDGELREPLMEKARELGVMDRMRFPGFRDDVPSILKAADVFCMPSHMEGLGTSVLDAMAARCPVVGTEAGGMPEMLEHEVNGLVCPIRDSAAVATHVTRLLQDPEWARGLAEKAYETCRAGFSRAAMVEGNLAVYREMIAARG